MNTESHSATDKNPARMHAPTDSLHGQLTRLARQEKVQKRKRELGAWRPESSHQVRQDVDLGLGVCDLPPAWTAIFLLADEAHQTQSIHSPMKTNEAHRKF